jgi:hypothetical protein
MKLFSLLQLQYNSFENAVKYYLSQTLSKFGINYGNNTIFGQLINVLNSAIQNIMLYIEDSLVEQNKYTAQRKKSIYGLAALAGYMPSLGQAAGVSLVMSYTPSNNEMLDVIINNHEKLICSQNGLQYCIILPQEAIIVSPDKDNTSRYISVVQGKFENQTFISIGGKYYTQNFNFIGNLDTKYLSVKINNKTWEYVENFYDMIPNGEQWTYKISPISGIDLIFGNNMHGKSLSEGDVIEVSYLLHDGEVGNLDINEETYFVFDSPLKNLNNEDINGNNIFNITFASLDAITSGSNSESIEHVRQMIGNNSRSLVLASPDNYKALLSRLSFCGYNRTWSEPGSMIINSLIMRNYKLLLNDSMTYFNLQENDFKLTESQKTSIKNFIQQSGMQLAGSVYNIFDPEICKYAMYIYLNFGNKSYDKEYVTNSINKLIAEFFSEIQSDIFIPKSDIIQLLKNNISDLDGVDVYFLSEKNETAIQKGYYDKSTYKFNPSTNTYTKENQTIYLYDGEDPNLGLDSHGNIYLESDEQFPVIMGGWDYLNKDGDEVKIINPLNIIFE